MKTLSYLLLCMFLFVQAQEQIPGVNPGIKSVSKLQSLPNGKYTVSKAISFNTNGKWLINGKKPESTIPKAEQSVYPMVPTFQTHHIIFHFDKLPIGGV